MLSQTEVRNLVETFTLGFTAADENMGPRGKEVQEQFLEEHKDMQFTSVEHVVRSYGLYLLEVF